jgi:hypothetical protein
MAGLCESGLNSRPHNCRYFGFNLFAGIELKLKKTREMFLVGAPRFELGSSCAQGKSRNAK